MNSNQISGKGDFFSVVIVLSVDYDLSITKRKDREAIINRYNYY